MYAVLRGFVAASGILREPFTYHEVCNCGAAGALVLQARRRATRRTARPPRRARRRAGRPDRLPAAGRAAGRPAWRAPRGGARRRGVLGGARDRGTRLRGGALRPAQTAPSGSSCARYQFCWF